MAYPRKILIIGASGSLGYKLFKECKKANKICIGTYHSTCRDELVYFDPVVQSLEDFLPELDEQWIVVMMAAYTSPNFVYSHPKESELLNIIATKNVFNFTRTKGAKFIFISSSMVFDGTKGNYTEKDIVNPLNLYGKQKVEVENYIQKHSDNYLIIRTDTVITDYVKSNCQVEKTYQTLYDGNAKMAHDNIFSIVSLIEFCSSLLTLITTDKKGIYHIVSSDGIKRTDFARYILNNSKYGSKMLFSEVPFSDITYPEKRPLVCNLSNKKIVDEFKMSFNTIDNIITKKVEIIDQRIESKGIYWR